MNDTYHIVLDQSLCSGMGDCAKLAPNAFVLGPDGIAVATVDTTNDSTILEAVLACPMAAIAAYRSSSGEQVA